jgi:polyhydroxybutyrate depolymerase
MLLIATPVLSGIGINNKIEKIVFGFTHKESHHDQNDCGCLSQSDKSEHYSFLFQPPDHILKYMFYKFQIRSYLVYLPPDYDGTTPMPLVITIHGCPCDAADIVERFKISEKAADEGFIAVYPNGNEYIWKYFFENKEFCDELCWNGRFCCGEAYEYDVDDVGFIRALIGKIQKMYVVDSERIFIAGHSNGGIMAHLLGAELSDIIAAVAPNAGTIGGKISENSDFIMPPDPDYPVSVVIFHGRKDFVFPFEGGKVYGIAYPLVKSVNESILFWVDHNNCDTEPDVFVSQNGNMTRKTYSNGDAGTEVVLYCDENGGHYWFGESFDPNQEMSTTDLMWEFFESHPKQ